MVKELAEWHATHALKALRNRAGLSMAEMAKLTGYKTASGYQRYENRELHRDPHLPLPLTTKLATALVGRGEPPIRREEVFALAGITPDGRALTVPLPGRQGNHPAATARLDRSVLVECLEEYFELLDRRRPRWDSKRKAIEFIEVYAENLGI